MLNHGGLAAEALKTTVMRALVRTLAGVNASVASQTRRIGKALVAAGMLAHVRLLASVRADVHSQSTALDEALAAARCVALVRTLIRVNAVVPLQIRLAVETFATCLPIAAERARRGFVFDKFHELHVVGGKDGLVVGGMWRHGHRPDRWQKIMSWELQAGEVLVFFSSRA